MMQFAEESHGNQSQTLSKQKKIDNLPIKFSNKSLTELGPESPLFQA